MTEQVTKFPTKTAVTILLTGGILALAVKLPWAVEKPIVKPVPRVAAPKVEIPDSTPQWPHLYDPKLQLKHFYEALEKTRKKEPGSNTLILHYGDSPVTADSITGDARAVLQARYGNAGHGFLLIAQPWAWYGHRGVELDGGGWTMGIATQARARDGLHGLGGVSFSGGPRAISKVTLEDSQSSVEVQFLEQPNGGTFVVMAGGQALKEISTEGAAKRASFANVELPKDSREVTLRVKSGTVRLFGYVFRRAQPGLIYSSLGLNGAQVQAVDRYFDTAHWSEELRHQQPDLLILNYGTNESVFPQYIETDYPKELREVIAKIRAALPETSILIMSPMDIGVRQGRGEIATPAILPRIVEIQKQAALETGCAFFDTYDAMGGAGTMAKWYNSQPRLVSADLIHPLPAGAAKVGALLADALEGGFEGWDVHRK